MEILGNIQLIVSHDIELIRGKLLCLVTNLSETGVFFSKKIKIINDRKILLESLRVHAVVF